MKVYNIMRDIDRVDSWPFSPFTVHFPDAFDLHNASPHALPNQTPSAISPLKFLIGLYPVVLFPGSKCPILEGMG